MRIAFFSDAYHPRVSGLVSSIDEFAAGFQARGHQFLLVCPSYPEERMAGRVDPPWVLRVPAGPAFVSAEDRLALPWRESEALARIQAFKPDIVHIQTEFSIGSLGRKYCRSEGLPIVSTSHTHYELYAKSYLPFLSEGMGRLMARTAMRRLYRRDDHIVVPSERIAAVLRSYGIEKEFSVIPTGVNEALFKPALDEAAALRAELSARHSALRFGPVVLYAGRIGHEKNILLLLDSFARVARTVPEASLLVVGDGPALGEAKRIAHELGIGGRTLFTGYQKRSSLPAYYSLARVFAFPSGTETQGLVTIESMLCGTPVVGVDLMGTAEVMAGDRGGLLSPPDPEAFSAALIKLLSDQDLWSRKAADALAWGRRWTVGASCERLEAVYARALAARGQGDGRD